MCEILRVKVEIKGQSHCMLQRRRDGPEEVARWTTCRFFSYDNVSSMLGELWGGLLKICVHTPD